MKAHNRRKAPGTEASKPKHESKSKGPPLFQRPEPTAAESKVYVQEIGAAYKRVKEARPARFDTPQKWATWAEAVRQKYALYQVHKTLGAQYFSREVIPEEVARYDWDFWRDMELLRGGDQAHLETAVAFLEADPFFYGSGYAKEDIIPAINRLDLPPKLIGRLQTVVLNIVDSRDGREFRAYCRLARKVDSPELREQLTRRLTHNDPNIRRRTRWVLEAVGEKVTKGNPI